ncbi:MAG: gas vesicle protein [uncultured archaeon A07HB70]|nr:MAG: gas vesicle protein [uncultured archaeon A07HB70]
MRPTRADDHAIVELLDVLLERGVVVQADIVVTVADVPLIGISLRAAIAGIAKMTEYDDYAWDRPSPG